MGDAGLTSRLPAQTKTVAKPNPQIWTVFRFTEAMENE
jgi:hypothetical protein